MFGNSFLKFIVIVLSSLCIICAVFTVVLKISPIYSIVLFILTLVLNIIDNIVTTSSYKKNMQSIESEMEKFKKEARIRRKNR